MRNHEDYIFKEVKLMKHCLPHILTVALAAAVRERGGEPPEELQQAGELGLLRDDQVRHGLQPPRLQGLRLLLRLPRIRGHRRPHRQVNMFKFCGSMYNVHTLSKLLPRGLCVMRSFLLSNA